MRPNRVVPLRMERIALDVDAAQLFVGNLLLGVLLMLVQYRFDLQPRLGRGMPDEFQDYLIRRERCGPPVDGDEAEHLMLNGIPLARTRRVVADMHGQAGSVGKLLE